jgi:hypothetical protein
MNESPKEKLLGVLYDHMGKDKAIGADALYLEVFGEAPKSKITGTRALRRLITEQREAGVPIASCSDVDGGGYYIAEVDSEREKFFLRMRRRGLRILAMEAKMRKISTSELLGQIQLNLVGEASQGAGKR